MRDAGAYVEDLADEDLESVTESFLEAGGELIVGEIEGRIVAMGAFRPVDESESITTYVRGLDDAAVEVTRMRVAPDSQRRGYAGRIYRELERRTRSPGSTRAVLDTSRNKPRFAGCPRRKSSKQCAASGLKNSTIPSNRSSIGNRSSTTGDRSSFLE
ncbi:GNAT family N-acetyltransferase [Natrinema halophilum]|uniref:GNAT family N-acetyltransferase n=1 Tax=Natrinema halophilum TaxID=1699371 RepID=UPI001F1EF699|nr:GNAT family N-acetyltransferase [Natrinema halophilum]UHQ96042.1 GNAT family N-acetyltransferase [Natrinema halophilum]